MAIKEGLRPGGRSARVQESIHSAVRDLLEEQDRSTVTVPQIAARAGVTPSTIYRRWGDLAALLAVSRNTVTRAFDQLYAEGYIEGRVGDGTYVVELGSARPLMLLRRRRREGRAAGARHQQPARRFRVRPLQLKVISPNSWRPRPRQGK